MPKFLLIRHASTDVLGKVITGRLSGVHLNERGKQEAERLAACLRETSIHAVYSSPQERCHETAEPIARALQLPVAYCDALDELDYGAWSGNSLDVLDPQEEWQRFNTLRSITAVPEGELILEIQTRIVKFFERLRRTQSGEVVALVTHAEPIRAALAHYLGVPIDLAHRLEIGPASISTIFSDEANIRILSVNHQPLCL